MSFYHNHIHKRHKIETLAADNLLPHDALCRGKKAMTYVSWARLKVNKYFSVICMYICFITGLKCIYLHVALLKERAYTPKTNSYSCDVHETKMFTVGGEGVQNCWPRCWRRDTNVVTYISTEYRRFLSEVRIDRDHIETYLQCKYIIITWLHLYAYQHINH